MFLALLFLLSGISTASAASTIKIDLEEEYYTKAGEKTVFLFEGTLEQGKSWGPNTAYLWEYKLPEADEWNWLPTPKRRLESLVRITRDMSGTLVQTEIFSTVGNGRAINLTINNTPVELNGAQFRATIGSDNKQSKVATLYVYEDVEIKTVPSDVMIFEGEDASFSVEPVSTTCVTYQWYKGTVSAGNMIAGADENTLVLDNLQTDDAGTYVVVVSGYKNESSETVSANLTVFEQPVVSPKNAAIGSEAVFSVDGGDAYTYQWHRGTPGSGTAVGDGTRVYTIEETQTDSAGEYYVTITAGSTTITSDSVELNVVSFSAQPEDVFCFAGKTASFEVTAPRGATQTTYQWFKGTPGAEATIIDGATGSKLEWTDTEPVSKDDEGTYFTVVTQTFGTGDDAETVILTTEPAQLTVFEQPAVSPKNAAAGTEIVFSVSGGDDYVYQWYKGTPGSGTPVGDSGRVYTIEEAQTESAGDYYVTVTDSKDATITSDSMDLNIVILSAHPENTYAFAGKTAGFEVTANGADETTIQWYKGTPGAEATIIDGATGSKLEWTETETVSKDDEGTYFAVVTQTFGTGGDAETVVLTSGTAQLTVLELVCADNTVEDGEDVMFSVVGTDGQTPEEIKTEWTYSWYENDGNGWNLIDGAAGTDYKIEGISTDKDGFEYTVRMENGQLNLEAGAIMVTVTPKPNDSSSGSGGYGEATVIPAEMNIQPNTIAFEAVAFTEIENEVAVIENKIEEIKPKMSPTLWIAAAGALLLVCASFLLIYAGKKKKREE
ncbi:hypothetical protein MsAg5_17050 [Methanosarcinaceae archaeon Ag5]|uniref:Ig-like domain-containing protein n=1 Tax=Methanolapillus africanus TaxID=3028297 RepID=A0AAE4SDP5_9EURY|nr:hypothetical protein [Methanosarcinaceae archaeon Ag5]